MLNKRTTPKKLINLTPIQVNYLADDHRFIVVTAGRRSRKTLIGTRKVLIKALRNPEQRFFLAAPTSAQARAIFFDKLKKETYYLRSAPPKELEMIIKLKNGSTIQVLGLDEAARMEGRPWHGGLITEFANIKPNAWAEHIRPVLADTNGFCIIDSVPESRNHLYDLALYASGGSIPKTRPKTGAYAENLDDLEWCFYSWFSSDVLNASEIEAAKKQLNQTVYKQEYEGSFEILHNLVYYEFDRALHVKSRDDIKNWDIGAGIDFNVDYCSAEVFKYSTGQHAIHFFDEIRANNTFELAKELKKLYPNIRVYPDAAGSARKSSATQSDHQILIMNGFKIRCHRSKDGSGFIHPPVRDRVNVINSLLKNAKGEISMTVDNKCKLLIKDFERVIWNKSGDISKTVIELTHASDAGSYAAEYIFPLRKKYRIRTALIK